MPILALILFGLAEIGMAWRSASAVATTAHAASLSLSRDADTRGADFSALQRVRAELSSSAEILSVIIYRTDGTTGRPPGACTVIASGLTSGTSGVDGLCNVYSGSYVASMSIADHDDPTCAGDADRYLCPTARRRDFAPADRIGIEISVRHGWITGFLPGGGRTIADRGVAALEPGVEM
jgi:hypothetical protein